MRRAFLALSVAAALLLTGENAWGQGFPMAPGTQEIQIGLTMTSLPEIHGGTSSFLPVLRYGRFLREGVELQLEGATRLWPLGNEAPKNYNGSGSLLWYPDLGGSARNFYLMAGGGGAWSSPATAGIDASFDPFVRAGFGAKVPLLNLGLGFLNSAFLAAEYRTEFLLLNENEEDYAHLGDSVATANDFVSGFTLAVSILR